MSSRETEPIRYKDLDLGIDLDLNINMDVDVAMEFNLRNWLIQLWRLAS